MTTTPPSTALSELTEAMVKAVPEVVERCVRRCDKCKIEKMMEGVKDQCCGDAVFPCSGILRRDNNPKHEFRRPITLADCMIAASENRRNRVHLGKRDIMMTILDYWDFRKDFANQSTRFYEWFHDVLCSKE